MSIPFGAAYRSHLQGQAVLYVIGLSLGPITSPVTLTHGITFSRRFRATFQRLQQDAYRGTRWYRFRQKPKQPTSRRPVSNVHLPSFCSCMHYLSRPPLLPVVVMHSQRKVTNYQMKSLENPVRVPCSSGEFNFSPLSLFNKLDRIKH